MMEYLVRLAAIFFIYSMAGWCIEVTLKYIQYHRFINRGFLTGPVCPIYGSGAVLITVAVGAITPIESSFGTTFVISFMLCGLLEYMTSFILEKQFHARWWDYSRKPMNLHGRVWIGNLILFGIGGVGIIHFINPLIDRGLNNIPLHIRKICICCLLVVFVADLIMTQFILKMVKTGIEKSEADNTEEIRQEIHLLVSDKSVFHRRFVEAYPDVVYHTDRINTRLEEIRSETEKMRHEAEQRLKEQRQHVAYTLEPAGMIKDAIIEKQSKLLSLMYDDSAATDSMKALYTEIEKDKERLEMRPLSQMSKGLPQRKHETAAERQ